MAAFVRIERAARPVRFFGVEGSGRVNEAIWVGVGGAVGTALSTAANYLAQRRRASGQVNTTDADELWGVLMKRLGEQDARLSHQDARITTLEIENAELRRRLAEKDRELAQLEAEVATLRVEKRKLDELMQEEEGA